MSFLITNPKFVKLPSSEETNTFGDYLEHDVNVGCMTDVAVEELGHLAVIMFRFENCSFLAKSNFKSREMKLNS